MARAVKICTKCKSEKELESFGIRKSASDGRDSWCKICINASARKRSQTDESRVKQLKTNVQRYGITLEEYQILHEAQNHKCAICEESEQYFSRLSIDHDHLTGRVRGLLCNNCNRGIGLLKDQSRILRKAAEYLDG